MPLISTQTGAAIKSSYRTNSTSVDIKGAIANLIKALLSSPFGEEQQRPQEGWPQPATSRGGEGGWSGADQPQPQPCQVKGGAWSRVGYLEVSKEQKRYKDVMIWLSIRQMPRKLKSIAKRISYSSSNHHLGQSITVCEEYLPLRGVGASLGVDVRKECQLRRSKVKIISKGNARQSW